MKVKIAAVLAVTAICLVWVLWGVDFSAVRSQVTVYRWWVLVPTWACYLAAHLCRVLRLGVLLGRPVPFGRLLSVNSIGFLAINVVPLRLGELVRPYLLFERERVPMGVAMSAIFIERILDFLLLLAMLLAAGIVDLPNTSVDVFGMDVVRAGQRMAGGAVGLGLLFTLAVMGVGEPLVVMMERAVGHVGAGRWRTMVALFAFMRGFRAGVADLVRVPARAAAALGLSVAIWMLTIMAIRVGLSGADLPGVGWSSALVTWAITLSAMTAVPTPGFFGAFEAAFSGALRIQGYAPSASVALALILHLGQLAFTVVVGGVFLVAEGWSLRDLVRRSRNTSSSKNDEPPVDCTGGDR